MPLLGAHMSIAGGLHLAFERLAAVGGEALQIFTRNQRQWRLPPLSPNMVARFRAAWEVAGFPPVAAHDSYLINLASPDPHVQSRSIHGFAAELQRAQVLSIPYLITHPGAHRGHNPEVGLQRYVEALDQAIAASNTDAVTVLIETTAGQGSTLGGSFDEIAAIVSLSRFSRRLGVCFDTCHVFAAGYDITSAAAYLRTMKLFDNTIGLSRLRFFHLNDSKQPLGSKVDRHQHIGKGEIGLEGFRLLLNDPRFRHHPMVLETPKGKELDEDRENLAVLRRLLPPGAQA